MRKFWRNLKDIFSLFTDWKSLLFIIGAVLVIVVIIKTIIQQQKKRALSNEPFDLKYLRHRRARFKALVERKIKLKRRLDIMFRIFYPAVRVIILLSFAAYIWSAKFIINNPKLGDYVDWTEAGLIALASFFFLILGNPFSIAKSIDKIKPVLETQVYGKFLGISNAIDMNEDELENLESKIKSHPENSEIKKSTS